LQSALAISSCNHRGSLAMQIFGLQTATSVLSCAAAFLDNNYLEVVQHWNRFYLQSAKQQFLTVGI
jgi:hypothetical protein